MPVATAHYVFTNADSPYQSIGTLRKRRADDLWFEFDLGDVAEIRLGSAISSATITAKPSGEMTVGTPAISTYKVGVQLASGLIGEIYALTCTVVTSGGTIIARTGHMEVS